MTPDDTFAALHTAAKAACGARLFTVTVLDRDAGLARRAYTSHPQDYPVSGTKQMSPNTWSAQVVDRAEPFVANDTSGFVDLFPDHALINALGCEAAMNIPVSKDGVVVGTVNILDAAGHFTPECAQTLTQLVQDHQTALLAAFRDVPMGNAA